MRTYKIIMILILTFLALASIGQAQIVNGTDCTMHFNFDVNLDSQTNECNPANNATKVGTPVFKNAGMFFNGYRLYDDAADYYRYDDLPSENIGDDDFFFCLWENTSGVLGSGERVIGKGTATERVQIQGNAGNGFDFYVRDAGADSASCSSANAYNDNDVHSICAGRNGANFSLWIDGNFECSATNAAVGSIGSGAGNWTIGNEYGGGKPFSGYIDEVILFTNATFVKQNATEFNASTINGSLPPAPVYGSVNMSDPQPVNNTQFNGISPVNLSINVSINSSFMFNCSLFINGTLNESINDIGGGAGINLSFNKSFNDGTWLFNITCTDNTSFQQNSTLHYIYIDTVDPIITVSNWTNYSVNAYQNITGVFNFTDEFMLFRYNISIDGSNIEGKSGISAKEYIANFTYDPQLLSLGEHSLVVTGADGHTANSLRQDYIVQDESKRLKYVFREGGSVRIQDAEERSSDYFISERQKDRYTFKYYPERVKTSYTFDVRADQEIYIAENPETKWKRWLIIGDHWLDFYLPKEPDSKVSIKKINKTYVQVTISNLKNPELQEYASIGDLNIVNVTLPFFTTNASITYSRIVSELETQTITLYINKTAGNLTTTNASLYWNGTTKSVTKTSNTVRDLYTATFLTPQISGATSNVSFNWIYNVTNPASSEAGNLSFNQTIQQIGIDNCSVYTTLALNFTLKDSKDDTLENGVMFAYVTAWIDDPNNYKAFNLSWNTSSSSKGVCISPVDGNYSANFDAEITATVPTFTTQTYWIQNVTLDNVSDNKTLYFTNNTDIYTFSVTDENDNAVQEAYIHVQKYDITTHSYIVDQILQTDGQGQALGNIIKETQWYQFMIVYKGEVKLQTTPEKLTGTSRRFRIRLGEDYFVNFNTVKDTSCRITFNNVTNNFALSFIDTTTNVTRGCLRVVKQTINGETLINETCLNASSGMILVNTGATENKTFIGVGRMIIGGDSFICGEPLSVNFDTDYTKFGLFGIFLAALLLIAIVTIGIFDPRIAIGFSIVALILVNLTKIYVMNWVVLMAVIIMGGLYIFRLNRQ